MMDFSSKKLIGLLVLIFIAVAIPRLIFLDLDHGDEFTDANVLNAGKNFAKFGFVKCRFLPFFDAQITEPLKNPYSHFPALPENINGLLRILFKTGSLLLFRLIAILLSLAAVIIWYFFVKKISGSTGLAFLGAVFYLSNPYFIYGFDDLQQLHYSELLRAAILFSFIALSDHRQAQRKWSIGVLWALLFITSLVTYEYVIFTFVFFLLFGRVLTPKNEERVSWNELVILGSASFAGFLLHFLQNVWFFNSFALACNDLLNIALGRSFGNYELSVPLNFLDWLKYVIWRNFSLVFLFDCVTLIVASFLAYILYRGLSDQRREKARNLFNLSAVLAFCGITWYVFFPSHALAHAWVGFVVRHLTLAASLTFTLFFYILWSYLKENSLLNLPMRSFFAGMTAWVVIGGVLQSQLPVTPAKIAAARDFLTFKHYLVTLKNISRPADAIGVNYHRYPFMSYYADRNFIVAHDRRMLKDLPKLPEYFIFLPYPAPYSQDLAKVLDEKYAVLFQCPSQRFPAVFMKRKDAVKETLTIKPPMLSLDI